MGCEKCKTRLEMACCECGVSVTESVTDMPFAFVSKPAPTFFNRVSPGYSANAAFEAAHTRQFQHQLVTHIQRAYACRRTGEDHIPGLQREAAGHVIGSSG